MHETIALAKSLILESFHVSDLRVVFSLTELVDPPEQKSPKMGEKYKIPLPRPAPTNGEKSPKNYQKYFENTIFVIFREFFLNFGGWTG